MEKVDLHIHSYFSDGVKSVEEIVELAKDLKYFAICDHNEYLGSLQATKLSNKAILGCEIDCVYDNTLIHILGYNFDYQNQELIKLLNESKERIENQDFNTLVKMSKKYPNIDLSYYKNYHYDKTRGGFKMLNYFIDLGMVNNMYDFFTLIEPFEEEKNDLYNVKEVIDIIHRANGVAILAHPIKMIKKNNLEDYINQFIKFGIDGIECYYPSHSIDDIDYLLSIANKNNLDITCGCDFHGHSNTIKIGQLDVDYQKLRLKKVTGK